MIIKERKMKEVKCQVCSNPVMVDDNFNTYEPCWTCGWINEGAGRDFPSMWSIANIMSLDKARQLYKQGKSLKPDFEDFMEFYEGYGEVEFKYKKMLYGMIRADEGEGVVFWQCRVYPEDRNPVEYSSIEDFKANAKIDGVLIKDLWDDVYEPGTLFSDDIF